MIDIKGNRDLGAALRALSLFSHLGLSMALCVGLGLLAGRFLDRWLGTTPWLMAALTFLGAAAAIKVMYDMTKDWK